MHRLFQTLLLVLFAFYFASSCYQPPIGYGGDRLSSRSNSDDEDNEDDDDRSSNRSNTRADRDCSDRDQCQDLCDDMFDNRSEISECYDLTTGEVNDIADVHDVFFKINDHTRRKEVAVKLFKKGDLDDIPTDDFATYLNLGLDTFVDRINETYGPVDNEFFSVITSGSDEKLQRTKERWHGNQDEDGKRSKEFLEWVVENKDVAEILLEKDIHSQIFQNLLIRASAPAGNDIDYIVTTDNFGSTNLNQIDNDDIPTHKGWISGRNRNAPAKGNSFVYITSNMNYLGVCKMASMASGDCDSSDNDRYDNDRLVSIADFGIKFDRQAFIGAFIRGINGSGGDGDPFVEMALDEGNTAAFEWAHNGLKSFCVEATDSEEDEEETKTCMQALYCATSILRDQEDIFDDLSDHEDITGNIDHDCDFEHLTNRRDIEKLFK